LYKVDISDIPQCGALLLVYERECEADYHKSVAKFQKSDGINEESESVTREVCCGAWIVKACVIAKLAAIQECNEAVNIYHLLPIDEHIRAEVEKKCSKYSENNPVCTDTKQETSFVFWGIVITVVIFLLCFLKPIIQCFGLCF